MRDISLCKTILPDNQYCKKCERNDLIAKTKRQRQSYVLIDKESFKTIEQGGECEWFWQIKEH